MASLQEPCDVAKTFVSLCQNNPEKSEAVVAIEVLAKVIESSDVSAVQGLTDLMIGAITEMCQTKKSNISVHSACELFQRFITLAGLDSGDFEKCKRILLNRAAIFIKKVGACRRQIAENALPVIRPGAVLLLYARSRCVLQAVATAAAAFRGTAALGDQPVLRCFVLNGGAMGGKACSGGGGGGERMLRDLRRLAGVKAQLFPDVALACLMPRVDVVLLGAEAVVESGGVLNRLGSATVATVASACGKPVYVLAESFKFLRCFPLDQLHIPDRYTGLYLDTTIAGSNSATDVDTVATCVATAAISSTTTETVTSEATGSKKASESEAECDAGFSEADDAWQRVLRLRASYPLSAPSTAGDTANCGEVRLPSVDYTGPQDVSLLITDLGALTPSAISDELIKLYL